MQSSQLRWPVWADAVISAEQGLVEARRYEGDEGYPWCRLCDKWCSQEHALSRLHLRRKWWHQESRVITMQPALIGSSSSLHSAASNALGASNGIIHSNISQAMEKERVEIPEIFQQERVQHCSVEHAVHVPKVMLQKAVTHVPEIVPQSWVQQSTVEQVADVPEEWQDWAEWQEWDEWQRNGWEWW